MYYQDKHGMIYDGKLRYLLRIASPWAMRYYSGLFHEKCKFTDREAIVKMGKEVSDGIRDSLRDKE